MGKSAAERLLRNGAARLSDAEVLSACVGHASSAALLERFGDVGGVVSATGAELLAVAGVGSRRAAVLKAALVLGERAALTALRAAPVLGASSSVMRYLRVLMAGLEREVFGCLLLDSRNRLIAFETLFLGTVDCANVHPREVLKTALGHNAAAVILAHNHPSGVPEPSAADVALTGRLRELLAVVDVRVLDHVVVGKGRETSMAERGLV